ncbi:altronate dehydratase family protein [Bradyrhizobium sp. CB3481]|uniref:UxaA family hydrolase n=1 Tax=Bradyrhizobium sp. CB3481 TaxID=3039158 RepID=UPI0024B06179|nr:altronate dehydratase family protein [Bradyrhizobium sp. CB3481]WFU14590.1 altronate dehydratase family protein [Bradyrhizobium sp. CB3481]
MNDRSYLVLSDDDNVAVATQQLVAGTTVGSVELLANIPRGHKFATRTISAGDPIFKYGQIIGFATEAIEAGNHVHGHNVRPTESTDTRRAVIGRATIVNNVNDRTFMGYQRANGCWGTRNFIGVMTSVNCAGTVAKLIADEASKQIDLAGMPIDGIAAFPHTTGCGMSDRGSGYELLRRTLEGYLIHPNFGGILMVGLGCEQMQITRLFSECGLEQCSTLRFLTIQGEGGTRATIDAGVRLVREMLPCATKAKREPAPIGKLSVALQCGGSDAYSGITANPALGYAVDLLSSAGANAILTETPEIFGAEHILAARARTPEVADKLYRKLAWWEDYTRFFGNSLNNNPSPGNKAGGLTTIMEKSLGAVAKGGTCQLEDVVEYAQRPSRKGLIFMDGPGFDPCSATGQIASGANVLCFTTGRGSAFGCKPVPSIKLASNSALFSNMRDDMDINCGDIVEGTSIQAKGVEIFENIIAVASGRKTKSELLGYGDLEFIPWQLHAVL